MKKPSSKIREEIARLQEQLKAAETREAERIGRLALKAGLGDIDVEEGDLISALEEIAGKFRKGSARQGKPAASPVASGATARSPGEA
ncbi:conjugal transfer protein TraC [Mesorhizobium xinjiangense]|uniref:conjugal transfer protein TraC n=1 Tax=Mesorhizobium xinjiangense TaxID=2678685 RepID=UPI0012ED7CFD|nr:conjugal transfer protein TraC [Mesorhizobium xinjiangense]